MRKHKILALLLTLIMAVSLVLSGCNESETTPQTGDGANTPDAEQYLNVALIADVRTLDSSKATDLYSATVQLETQEGLIRVKNDGKKDIIEKAGAKDWTISSDGLTWTFTLRDYNWSDGKPVTAKDFEYAWKRLLAPETKAGYAYLIAPIIKGAEAYNAGEGKVEDVKITAKDDKTLVVELVHPVPYFDKLLGMQGLLPLRQDIVEAAGETYGQDPSKLVYCGPFTVSEWTKGTKVVLKKNPSYWDAANVKLETVNLPVIKDQNARMKAFETKEIDAVAAKGEFKEKYKGMADQKQLVWTSGYEPSTNYVFFNCKDKDKVFTNRNIRMAFSLAIDRETFVNNVVKFGVPAYGWAPYQLMIGDDQFRDKVPEPLKEVKDDPKELLLKGMQELGLGNDPSKLTVTFLSSGTDADSKSQAEALQDMWQKKLGVTVKLDAVTDFPQFLDRIDNEQFQISAMAWAGDYNDPMTFFDMWTIANAAPGGNNSAKWESQEYDDLIEKLMYEQDNAKRLEMFKQAEKMVVVDAAAIAPYSFRDKDIFKYPYVKDLTVPLFGPLWDFKTAYTQGRE